MSKFIAVGRKETHDFEDVIAVSKPESSERKDIFIEFESANTYHARRHIMDNFNRELEWLFFKKPLNGEMPRTEVIKRKG